MAPPADKAPEARAVSGSLTSPYVFDAMMETLGVHTQLLLNRFFFMTILLRISVRHWPESLYKVCCLKKNEVGGRKKEEVRKLLNYQS